MAIEEFTSAGARDFRQRYLGVYGYFTTSNNVDLLVYLSQITDRETKFTDRSGIEYTARVDQGVAFRFIPVERRLFVHNDVLVLSERRPMRQYSRGISESNTLFYEIRYSDPLTVNFSTITAYNTQKYVDKDDLFEKIASNNGAALLNSFLGVQDNFLYLYGRRIGHVFCDYLKDAVSFNITDKLFYQEVCDVVKHRGYKAEVKCV